MGATPDNVSVSLRHILYMKSLIMLFFLLVADPGDFQPSLLQES